MHWDLGTHRFDDERDIIRSLVDNDVIETILEPKASALLKYFCNHSQTDLSRDELIANVWHGQIVSDNAINRVVVQLRKALRDDDNPRQFIKTIPKVGYRLITQPRPREADEIADRQRTKPDRRPLLASLGVLVLAATLIGYFLKQPATESGPVAVQPLSRQTGWQFDADLSPNLQQLIFSVAENGNNRLFLQHLETGQIQQISPDTGQAHGGRWGHDDPYFVYVYHTRNHCEFRKVTVSDLGTIESNDVLQTCRANSTAEFALSLDDEILYFVERDSPFSPYQAFALDMQEQQRWKLAQPLATSYGNHYLDVHPETGKVLLLSEPKPGSSAVYEVDVPSNGYRKLHEFDYDLYSAVWGHEPNTVVHPAEHPSYQLLKTDLKSGQSSVIVSDSRRISTPRRINNEQDYLFASYLYNRDIAVRDYAGPDFNSAVMDYLPEFSRSGDRLAFVSKRAGFSQILVLDLASQSLRTLDIDDQGLTYYNLAWSQDDKQLAANTSKGIVVYDLDRDTYKNLAIQQLTYAVDWSGPMQVSFSQFEDGKWQAYRQDVTSGELELLPPQVAFSVGDSKLGGFVTQDLRTFRSSAGDYTIEVCGRYIARFHLHIKLEQGRIYCVNPENNDELLVIDAGEQATAYAAGLNRPEYIAVRKGQLATAYVSDASSDVMRTELPVRPR